MKCLGHCEINVHANNSYKAIHNIEEGEFFARDISKVKPYEIPLCNLWCFGFPCQDISTAGKREGLAGRRSGLFFEIIRLLKGRSSNDRPNWLVLENVRNLLSVNDGWDFATVLLEISKLGYHIEYGVLNTKNFGLPQSRGRIFVVGYRHFGSQNVRRIFPITYSNRNDSKRTLQASKEKGIKPNKIFRHSKFDNSIPQFVDLCREIKPRIRKISSCIVANYYHGISRRREQTGVLIDNRVRWFTPRECWRLQGFSDEMFDKAQKVCSKNQLYKQAGNSVSIPVIEAIGRKIILAEGEIH